MVLGSSVFFPVHFYFHIFIEAGPPTVFLTGNVSAEDLFISIYLAYNPIERGSQDSIYSSGRLYSPFPLITCIFEGEGTEEGLPKSHYVPLGCLLRSAGNTVVVLVCPHHRAKCKEHKKTKIMYSRNEVEFVLSF